LNMGSLTLILLKDLEACRIVADELHVIAERNRFPWPLTCALFIKAWLKAQGNDQQAGIEQMLKIADNADTSVFRDILFALIAEQLVRAGQADSAMRTLDRAVEAGGVLSDKFYEAEMMRMQGEVLLAQTPDNAQKAEAEYRRAMELAAQQSNRAIELRAVTSLSRLLSQTGRSREAHDMLTPVYGAFTEGFDRPDLLAAKALLAELQ
jgi:predicted ATPase